MAGKIFINYRRNDSIATAGRLHDRLVEAFGGDNLFWMSTTFRSESTLRSI